MAKRRFKIGMHNYVKKWLIYQANLVSVQTFAHEDLITFWNLTLKVHVHLPERAADRHWGSDWETIRAFRIDSDDRNTWNTPLQTSN